MIIQSIVHTCKLLFLKEFHLTSNWMHIALYVHNQGIECLTWILSSILFPYSIKKSNHAKNQVTVTHCIQKLRKNSHPRSNSVVPTNLPIFKTPGCPHLFLPWILGITTTKISRITKNHLFTSQGAVWYVTQPILENFFGQHYQNLNTGTKKVQKLTFLSHWLSHHDQRQGQQNATL